MSLGSAVSRRAQQWSGNVAFSSDDNAYKKESVQQEIIRKIISTAANMFTERGTIHLSHRAGMTFSSTSSTQIRVSRRRARRVRAAGRTSYICTMAIAANETGTNNTSS